VVNERKRSSVAIHEEGTSPAVPQAVAAREPRRTSGVQAVARASRAEQVGASTMKQNPALLERLRQVAMRSEHPTARDLATLEAPAATREPLEEETTTEMNPAELIDAYDTTARAFALLKPPPHLAVERVEIPVTMEEAEAEVSTTMFPAKRRARRRRVVGLVGVVAALALLAVVGVGLGVHRATAHAPSVTSSRIP
jgi:hypothetical protein